MCIWVVDVKCIPKSHMKLLTTMPYVAITVEYRIMQIVCSGKLLRFSRISFQSRKFSSKIFVFITRCFKLLYNRESFPANNKKIMQPRNFSTANDLHYTVCWNAQLWFSYVEFVFEVHIHLSFHNKNTSFLYTQLFS